MYYGTLVGMISRLVVAVIITYLSINHGIAQDYSIRQFFKDLPPEHISLPSAMTEREKKAIIEYGFSNNICPEYKKRQRTIWKFTFKGEDTLVLVPCYDSDRAIIHRYKHLDGGYVIVLAMIMGNHGQTQHLRFYRIDSDNKIVDDNLDLVSLGLLKLKDNDFLAKSQYFPADSNHQVPLYYADTGIIYASPWTWMEARWEEREVIYDIWFVWDGHKFVKKVRKIN